MTDFSITTDNVTEEQLTHFFLADPALCYLGLSDQDMNSLYCNKKYPMSPNSKYIGLYTKNELIGFFKMEAFSEVAICCHVFIATKLHGAGHTPKVWAAIRGYILEHYNVSKVISTVPEPCVHVKKAVEALGAEFEGKITKVCTWRQEIVDLLFYSIDLNKEVI